MNLLNLRKSMDYYIPLIIQNAFNKRIAKVIYLVLVTMILFIGFSHWGYDDPFITYRYSENLRHGLGFVFNSGEKVLSTTTPLFTLLLALLGEIWSDIPKLANLIGAFSLALGGLFLWDLAQTWHMPLVGWGGLFLYPTFPLLVSTMGSETLLYIAICLGAFAMYARQSYSLTAIFSALAVLTRPDGILVAIILAAHFLLIGRRQVRWVSIALFLCLTIPWFVFAWSYFGSPLPVTMVVKQHQGSMAISQGFFEGWLTIFRPYLSWPYFIELGLVIAGLIFMFRKASQWVLILFWTLLYFFSYSVLGVSRYFWYYAPLLPIWIVMIGLGVSSLQRFFSPNRKRIFWIGFLVLFLCLSLVQSLDLWHLRQTPDPRLIMYRDVGEWLQENTLPSSSVGTLEVGIIGFYSQRKIIDFAGLIQPIVGDQLTKSSTYDDSAVWAVDYFQPDYLALSAKNFPRLEQEYITQHCEIIRVFLAHAYGNSTDFNIYQCN